MNLQEIPGVDRLPALHGPYTPDLLEKSPQRRKERKETRNKIVPSLEEAIRLSGLKDGMTISFHHHFRGGDAIVNMVVDKLAEMGFHDLTLAASSLTTVHASLIQHIKSG